MIDEQLKLEKELTKIFEIFQASEGEIRPHFILTGGSGTGKTFTISKLADMFELDFLEVNAAQLTKEGVSGNSLSKALSPLANRQGGLTVCFVDEFDKLFISGNNNSDLAHESTTAIQNEFLKVLEADNTSVFGDYGKYVSVPVDNVLFIFAGAFNGQEEITIDTLRDFGVKTEFLGRVGLVYNTTKLSLESMLKILSESKVLHTYLDLYSNVSKKEVIKTIGDFITKNYEKNTLGARMINTLINQYFIKGGKLEDEVVEKSTFQKKLSL